MDVLENVFVDKVHILYCHENGDCQEPDKSLMIAIRNVHVLDLSCSNQLMISNQNTHAFRPNFIVAPFKAQWRHRRADFLPFLGTLVSLPPGLFVEAFKCRRGLVLQAAPGWSQSQQGLVTNDNRTGGSVHLCLVT